ncbi:ubiquitin carboxyl-terminal hydrolase 40 [Carcharodon carcharias]|uniref:ubiquitin carboxyl-terminal hydrolase 40 n=1 Tax=Carcharodon carcharias TaxID=13397 RepID=UPI001B7E8545|nr:ubiquitin carboxyl-terminal hydrolase 40 [Carcharodon carcharias]XP_041056715.1 ubiquitin carboxyl-terminal hydrolase 40 [Carcharodon carcharias]
MFGDMFEEEEDAGFVCENKTVKGRKSRKKDTDPPPHRAASNLSGIKNQGGTCYLNSLLQTLLYTPEFRESLFALGPEELGYLSDKDKPESKVRVIPLELQRLFAQLLLADQLAASTSDLTDSFGWTSNEETSQHDVQELNRILFSALESSLVGTSGHDLINRLYHGIVVNKIVCKECGNISERQEDFLDLTVAVKGVSGLEEALCTFYVEEEDFDNDNLYQCGRCEKLVKATKAAKLRHLPTFLTISLLRFNFDFAKCERYKETGRYSFPVRLNLRPFCEQDELPDSEYEYELFSVIIHKGGCYGGHYHAYIKDIDQLGTWFSLDEENVVINSTKDPTNVDNLLELGDPLEILRTILGQMGPDGILVDQLGQKLLEKVGVAWNKRYRKQHGSLRKFLESHPDVFLLKADGTRVAVKQTDRGCPGQQPNTSKAKTGAKAQTGNCKASIAHAYETEERQPRTPDSEVHWFDFDDSQVRPIQEKDIEKQFQGKECAYMLFYRKSQLQRPAEARGNSRYKVPPDLLEEIANLDASLQKQRAEFDSAANNIEVHLHLGPEYKFDNGALHPASSQKDSVLTITIDRRKTVGDLRQAIFQLLEFWKGDMVITVAKQLPAGLHLYETFNEDHASLHSLGITDGAILFVWNGNQVCGMEVQAGEDYEPVLLKVLCPTMSSKLETEMVQFTETQTVFTRNTLFASVQEALALSTGISPEELTVYCRKNLENKGSTNWVAYDADDAHKSLADLRLKDGDSILASDQKCHSLSVLSFNGMPVTVADRSWLQVKNYCGESLAQTTGATVTIPVTMEMLIVEIKANAIEKLKLKDEQEDGTCLRPIDRTGRLLPPVCEDLTVKGIGLKTGSSLALFPGHTPTETQLFLYFSVGDSLHLSPEMEIVVEQSISVRECLKLMLEKAGLAGEYWHLRKTDWCYDAGEILKDEEATLADMKITNGETLVIMEGRLPPKGFLILPVWLYQPPLNSGSRGRFQEDQENIADRLCALNIESAARDFSLQQYMGTELKYMGNIEISGEASLEDLKTQVLTLPVLQDPSVPSVEFLRVWLVENKCPVKILRNQQQQLSKFKLGASAEIGIQPLQAEEHLLSTEFLLRLQMAVPGERSYYPAEEFVWDTSKECTARALKQKIVQHYSLPPEQIEIAKYFPDQFEWMPMTSWSQQVSKKKKKKKLQSLQGAPYYLKDGDIIGVKNLLIDKNKDFSTMADDIGKEKLRLEGNNKDKRQQATAHRSGDAPESSERQTVRARARRPEVALSISVADFR